MFINEVKKKDIDCVTIATSMATDPNVYILLRSLMTQFKNTTFLFQTVVIDDASAAKLHKLLLIVMLVSNFPLIIVGMGAIMLLVFILLMIRARKQKVLGQV